MSQYVPDSGIALVRKQTVKAWRLRQDTVLEKSLGHLVSSWLQRLESGSDERHRVVAVLENDPHRSVTDVLQNLGEHALRAQLQNSAMSRPMNDSRSIREVAF